MVSYATEGYTWPRNALYLLHNTFVDRRPAGGIFLRVRAGDARIVALNNLLIGNGSSRLEDAGAGDYRGNVKQVARWLGSRGADTPWIRGSVDMASALADTANIDGMSLQPRRQFQPPTGTLALHRAPAFPGAIQIEPRADRN